MNPFGWMLGFTGSLLWFIVTVLVLYWVYNDARERYPRDSGMPLVWLVIVLFTGLLGLIVYLIARPRERGREGERYQSTRRYEPIEPE